MYTKYEGIKIDWSSVVLSGSQYYYSVPIQNFTNYLKIDPETNTLKLEQTGWEIVQQHIRIFESGIIQKKYKISNEAIELLNGAFKDYG